jgi:CubicO group peptidase (beta-lactamase class C family)
MAKATSTRNRPIAAVTVAILAMVATVPALALDAHAAAAESFFRLRFALWKLIHKHDIPGVTVAVMKDGRLVLADGLGWADEESWEPARADTLFRIASVSKSITAVTVLRLVEQGKLHLEDKAFALLPDITPPAGETPDPRLQAITVRDLLQHSGGWDSSEGGDPQFGSLAIAEALGIPSPPSPRTVVGFWMGQPLQFDPGTRHSYSNFGYNVLGRIIEKITGQSYETHVLSEVLTPLGIRRMRLGASLKEQRARGEGTYHANRGAALVDSVFPALGKVPKAYGGWSHEALDAHGGWIASAVDLLRFVRGVEGSGGQPRLLSDAMLAAMVAYPQGLGQAHDHYYALGWDVDDSGKATEQWSHTGALENSNAALLVRQTNGVSYAVVFNALPNDYVGFFDELQKLIKSEVAAVTRWPSRDLFPTIP